MHIGTESFYVPGEYLAWSVKWKGLAGGRTQFVVGEPGEIEGHRAIIARSETRGDGLVAVFKHVRDELTTTIDLSLGGPGSSDGTVEDGRDIERLAVEFEPGGYRATLRLNGDEPLSWNQRVAPGGHVDDLHTAMAHLRIWKPSVGTRGFMFSQSGQSFYKLEVTAAGREKVQTEAGTYDTVRLEGTAFLLAQRGQPPKKQETRRFTLWFSDDDAHLPVRIVAETTFGDVYAELVENGRTNGHAPLRIKHSAR